MLSVGYMLNGTHRIRVDRSIYPRFAEKTKPGIRIRKAKQAAKKKIKQKD
jgi:hypothetical protein